MDFSFIPTAMAQTAPLLDASASYTTSDMMRLAIALVVFTAGLCAIGFVVWGGFMLVLSGGDDGKIKSATNMIRFAFVGLAVIVVTIFVLPKVTQMLGLGTFNITPQYIFDTVQGLTHKVFGGGNSGVYYNSSSTSDINFDNF